MVGYLARFDPDPESDRFFVIGFPDIPWGISQGESEEDGRNMALDLLRTVLSEYIRKGEELPHPKVYRGARFRLIVLPALDAAKVELYRAFQKSRMRKVDLARALGIPKSNVDSLFSLNRKPRGSPQNRPVVIT